MCYFQCRWVPTSLQCSECARQSCRAGSSSSSSSSLPGDCSRLTRVRACDRIAHKCALLTSIFRTRPANAHVCAASFRSATPGLRPDAIARCPLLSCLRGESVRRAGSLLPAACCTLRVLRTLCCEYLPLPRALFTSCPRRVAEADNKNTIAYRTRTPSLPVEPNASRPHCRHLLIAGCDSAGHSSSV